MQIDGSTKLVGVFGWPITHTASPAMHNAAFEALRMNWKYLAFAVDPVNLKSALHGARDLGMIGVNLTVPHKILALDLVGEVDPQARKLGAVNTVCIENGLLRGFNTDGYGFAKAIKEEFNFSLRGKRVLVLGAGGAGRAIAIQCAADGAAKVLVANRTPGRIEPIAKELASSKAAFQAVELSSDAIARVIREVDLLVNATSVGLAEGETLALDVLVVFTETVRVRRGVSAGGDRFAEGCRRSRGQGGEWAWHVVASGCQIVRNSGRNARRLWP